MPNHPFSEVAQNKLCQNMDWWLSKMVFDAKISKSLIPIIITARQWLMHSNSVGQNLQT
jgi:hypothetical protein